MIKMLRRHIDSFYDYLEKLKSKDSLSTNVAKIIFIIGKQGWVHSIIALIMGVIIPMFLDKGKSYESTKSTSRRTIPPDHGMPQKRIV